MRHAVERRPGIAPGAHSAPRRLSSAALTVVFGVPLSSSRSLPGPDTSRGAGQFSFFGVAATWNCGVRHRSRIALLDGMCSAVLHRFCGARRTAVALLLCCCARVWCLCLPTPVACARKCAVWHEATFFKWLLCCARAQARRVAAFERAAFFLLSFPARFLALRAFRCRPSARRLLTSHLFNNEKNGPVA